MRSLYGAFRGERLAFEGQFYSFSLLPPMWTPPPIEYDDPPIYLAGVRPWMCSVVGEVADGMLVHPLSSIPYIDDVVLPAIARGAERSGRSAAYIAVVCPVMTAVSDDESARLRQRENIRTRLAFYGSTPGYGVVYVSTGWPGVGEELNRLQRAGELEQLSRTITDDMVDQLAVTSTWDELPGKLVERYGTRADQVVCYSVFEQWDDDDDPMGRWQDVNRRFRDLVGT
jgi:probable F420-dependent oxidoreductase